MRIGELSERTGVAPRLLRYYEEQGLLAPARTPSGYREYDATDVEVVRRIRSLLAAGIGTTTIAQILPCILDNGDEIIPVCDELLTELHAERDRIDDCIDQLQASRDMLDHVLAGDLAVAPTARGADRGASRAGHGSDRTVPAVTTRGG